MGRTNDDGPQRSSLAIDQEDQENDHTHTVETETGNDGDDNDASPLRHKILSLVQQSPNYTIRPSTLSQSLGISLSDANAELCGLLQAVGEGSSFRFESMGDTNNNNNVQKVHLMVFEFPPDFERRALRQQRQQDWMRRFKACGSITLKAIKVLTAFGLILSIVIVSIAGMVALIAAFVALSRDAGGHSRGTRTQLTRQMNNLFLTVRQLLWCYAMFGPMGEGGGENNQDPFFRDVAYDSWLVLSLCCGNPGSIFFWWRAQRMRQRRQRYTRGWGSGYGGRGSHQDDNSTELEGITLIRRNRLTGEEEQLPVPSSSSTEEHRGLLSALVEFLFGPNSLPGPSEADRWRLRGAVIVDKAANSNNKNGGNEPSLSLQEFMPYADFPPRSLDDSFQVTKEGLSIIAHFNGIPSSSSGTEKQTTPSKVKFNFPELLAEGSGDVRYDDPRTWEQGQAMPETRNWWDNFLYVNEATDVSPASRNVASIPKILFERPRPFSQLTRNQFLQCLSMAVLNWIGVIWFAQSVQLGGILHDYLHATVGNALRSGLIPVLWFYARLFLAIPLARMLYIVLWNKQCYERNRKRSEHAKTLKSSIWKSQDVE